MEKNIKHSVSLPLIIVIASMLFSGCQKDTFNPEKVKATYQDRFPVKDIDPSMDWKMTRQVKVSVSVHEDAGTDYTVRIYDKNPLSGQSSAKLLAEGTANQTTTFSTVMDCPTTVSNVFVCRTDPHNRSVVKYVSIENDQVNAAFGIAPSTTRSAWTRSVSIETYTPHRTESEIATLAATAQELASSTKLEEGDVYKISENEHYQNDIRTKNKEGISGKSATVIIEGTWEPGGNIADIETGVDLIVTGTGKIILPKNMKDDNKELSLKGTSRLIVFQGGVIEQTEEGEKGGVIQLPAVSDGRYNYNAGTIHAKTIQIDKGGCLYSCGTLEIDNLEIAGGEGKLINQGKATIGDVNASSIIENGCYLHVTDELEGDLIMGDNSSALIYDFGDDDDNENMEVTMGDNSMITIENEAEFSNVAFYGPSEAHALVKINELESMDGFTTKGNIYYEVKETDDDINLSDFSDAIKDTGGTLSHWGESPILIPAGDCTGEGNTPADSGSELSDDGIPYTYVFEDNYPLVGDYDFNDVVLDVVTLYHREKKTNCIKRIQLDITLAAAGASKAVGVGLRIVGISKSDINLIKTGGDDSRFQGSFEDPNCLFKYSSGSHMEDSDPSVVIPIAGEVHNVFGAELGTLINTGDGVTSKAYRYEVIIELADQSKTEPLFSKDNLDFFICYRYKGMQKRMEVHLYEFWDYGATAAGTVQQENLDVAGNNTWAICVPYGFRYPKERINISRTDIPDESAYPDFIHWAKDRDTHTDWYENPVSANVYR